MDQSDRKNTLERAERGSLKRASSQKSGNFKLKTPSIMDEWQNVLLLIILYMVQGIPLGLSMGSMPFLMRSTMSYTKIGIFTLTGYPYSFKLLWSPIVDSVFNRRLGRRKSWILPLQTCSGILMIMWGAWLEEQLVAGDAVAVTILFFVLVLLAATQDIAVDGWALTLLSKENLGYASTCQTVGMNLGYFTSFTVFLALNDPDFCNKFLRTVPSSVGVLSLSNYLVGCGWLLLLVTIGVALFKKEVEDEEEEVVYDTSNGVVGEYDAYGRPSLLLQDDGDTLLHQRRKSSRIAALRTNQQQLTEDRSSNGSIKQHHSGSLLMNHWKTEVTKSYSQLFGVVKLPSIKLLALILIVCRLGMLPAESAGALKLLEKGVSKESLAGLVLVEFPVELVSALVAGRWASHNPPLGAWLFGYRLRLLLAAATTALVAFFPANASGLSDAPEAFIALAIVGVATSFASTLMFTAMGSFYNKISDPSMGGAYLTLLNTLANIGVVVPKLGVFAAMDMLTIRQCVATTDGSVLFDTPALCSSSTSGGHDEPCINAGGSCVTLRDGFYLLSSVSVVMGAGLMMWLQRVLPRLDSLPQSAWRATIKQQ